VILLHEWCGLAWRSRAIPVRYACTVVTYRARLAGMNWPAGRGERLGPDYIGVSRVGWRVGEPEALAARLRADHLRRREGPAHRGRAQPPHGANRPRDATEQRCHSGDEPGRLHVGALDLG